MDIKKNQLPFGKIQWKVLKSNLYKSSIEQDCAIYNWIISSDYYYLTGFKTFTSN